MPDDIDRTATQIADILMREGLDYTQTKAVFKQARAKAGLHAPNEHRSSPARLTLEEELRFIDQAYAQGGQVGLMMQVLPETGTRVSEFAALRVEDVSLAEPMTRRSVSSAEAKMHYSWSQVRPQGRRAAERSSLSASPSRNCSRSYPAAVSKERRPR